MTIEELGRMADEYAKEIAPDNKEAQTAISADSLGFLNKVMEKCCLVEKSKIKETWSRITDVYLAHDHITYEGARCLFDEVLFPDIAKEVEG